MRCVLQRVTRSSVDVGGKTVGAIGPGLMVLIGVREDDTDADLDYMIRKVPDIRIFDDADGVMNLSVKEAGGSILAVSQFTLLADARKGRRPSFSEAEEPEEANRLYKVTCDMMRDNGLHVEEGVFRAHMDVEIHNNGPVTILLDSTRNF